MLRTETFTKYRRQRGQLKAQAAAFVADSSAGAVPADRVLDLLGVFGQFGADLAAIRDLTGMDAVGAEETADAAYSWTTEADAIIALAEGVRAAGEAIIPVSAGGYLEVSQLAANGYDVTPRTAGSGATATLRAACQAFVDAT